MAEDPMDTTSSGFEERKADAARRVIPQAQFVENVEEFLAGREVEPVLKSLDERLQQYKLVEMRLLAQRRDLQAKLPDITKCLEIVRTLQAKQDGGQEMKVDFELADGIYTQAVVRDATSVCLWLGANVMLEYPFDEALALLSKNKENAQLSLANLISDIHFLRDQTNITEVTIARVYNWDVAQRRKRKPAAVREEEPSS